MKKAFITLIILTFATINLIAAPARRIPRTFTQPDGTTVTVILQGDEFSHHYTTVDGILLSKTADGFYYTMKSDNGAIEASSMLAHNKSSRSTAEVEFIDQINKQEIETVLSNQRNNKINTRSRSPQKANEVVNKGEPKVLILLVQFSDVKFSENDALVQYTRRMTEENYHDAGGYGSVKDYFMAQSNGLFTPQFEVTGPVTLKNNMKYYGGNDSYGDDLRPGEMVKEACQIAKETGLISNFADFDNDNDGYVDVVYVIYAGFGEASSEVEDSVWPHQWDLRSATGSILTLDNVKINKYACNNELFQLEEGILKGEIDGIGTFCHEFSHCLGLPDFYDTRSNGSNFGMDVWSIMDYGCYNNNGHTPCGYTAYEREFMEWMEIENLTSPTNVTLEALHLSNQAYRIINDANSNEYYVLENRQKQGWDEYMEAHGLMILHVDYSSSVWNNNTVNNVASRQRMTIAPADNRLTRATFAGDLYPGPSKNTSFTSTSLPASTVYTGAKIDKPVTEIAETNGIITFKFMGGGTVSVPESSVSTENFTVYTSGNEIVISTEIGHTIQIYSIDGVLKHKFVADSNENRISANNGIYIIHIDNKSVKVIVSKQ